MNTEQLATLKNAYSSGILEVREDDMWVKYNSMKEMRIAIREAEADLSNSTPTGTRLVTTGRGY